MPLTPRSTRPKAPGCSSSSRTRRVSRASASPSSSTRRAWRRQGRTVSSADEVTPQVTHRAAVLGSPVAHSLSPALHRAGYAAAGLTGWEYQRIECDAATLPGLVAGSGPEWAGFSVTMPGKSAAASMADQRSARVAALGVANTLVRRDGGWLAENTDADGLIGALRAAGAPAPKRVLLLGGGGTAASVIAALSELGTDDV